MFKLREIEFVRHKVPNHRRHFVDENDVKIVLSRLPENLLSRLKKIHFNDEARGNRCLGYTTTRGRREVTLCALPHRMSLSNSVGARPPEVYGAKLGSQWPVLAVRRFMLYNVLLHEIGHLQIILPKNKNPNRKFASEGKAEEFAQIWRKKLWAEPFDHPDPVHNSPGEYEIKILEKGWVAGHLRFKDGLKLENSGERQKAEEAYREAIKLYPFHAQALERAGVLMYAGLGVKDRTKYWENVAVLLRSALAVDPVLYDATLYLGMVLSRLDERDEARKMFERAIGLGPYSDIAKTTYAEHLGYWGEFDQSESLFKRVLKKDPKDGLALRNYANMLMYKTEGIDFELTRRAIELLGRSLEERDGLFHYSHYPLGVAHSWLEENEVAIKHLKEAVRLKPDYKKAIELLAELES